MPSDPSLADPAAADPLLRPAWADTPDETDRDLRPPTPRTPPRAPGEAGQGNLLSPLCAAADALARLDASAAAAPEPVRAGLIARLALLEAAGCLAHAQAWIHPLDLALRDLGLAHSLALVATGGGRRALPHTAAAGATDWDDTPLDDLPSGEAALADALALARFLPRLAGGGGRDPGRLENILAAGLATLGARDLTGKNFAAWWRAQTDAAPDDRRRRCSLPPPSPAP